MRIRIQNPGVRIQNASKRYFAFLFFLLVFILASDSWILDSAFAKVYIDITSPGLSRLPIAVQSFSDGKEISDIVRDDLTFTGLFACIDETAQIERPDQPFSPANWRGLGAELVVKGRVTSPPGRKTMTVVVSAHDVTSGSEVLKKEYSASSDLLRLLAHSIANDIYTLLTAQQGVFKTKIAFVGEKGGKKELYLMDWDGHRLRGLGVNGGVLLTPRWSSDGTRLLYSAERQRQWGFYLLDMNTMRERSIAFLKGLNMAGNFFPGNREFVFSSSKDGNSDIFTTDINGAHDRKIISSPWIDVSPVVSQDGSSIAFVSNRSGNPHIYVADKDGYGVRRLTFEGTYNTSPAWSPLGDRIAFVGRAGGRNHIFIIKTDGSALTQLTQKGNNEDPSFSPDGRYLVFTSDRDGSKGLYIMRINGEGERRITPKGLKASSPSWSPY